MKEHLKYLLQGLIGLIIICICIGVIIGVIKLCTIIPLLGIPITIILVCWLSGFLTNNT